MKKLILSLFTLFGMAGALSAQTVTVADVETLPGNTVKTTLNFECPADTYTGMQITLQFPASTVTVASEKAVTGWDGSLEYTFTESDGKLKFSAASSSSFSAATISVEFTVGNEVALGDYDVTVSGQLEGPGVDDAVLNNATFKLKVVNILTIDENSTTLPVATKGVDVVVKRAIKSGVWTPICLPFNMTEAQVKEIFGDDVKFAEFSDFENGGTEFVVNFSSANLAEGGFYGNWPYLVKTSKDITEFSVKAVDVDPKEDEAVAEYETGSGKKKTVVGAFYGTLKAGATVPADNLIFADGELKASDGTAAINGLQGYLWLKDYTAASTAKLKIDGKIPTAIEGLNIAAEDGSVYNMSGMKIQNPTQKGVYIRNGRKVVIK